MNVLAFVGEIRMYAGKTPPEGWLFCDGSLRNVWDYEALFSSIGTLYGGDGYNQFALPNLCGRVPINIGTGPGMPAIGQGNRVGVENVQLTADNLPAHNHAVNATTTTVSTNSPAGAYLGTFPSATNGYVTRTTSNVVTMNAASVGDPVTVSGTLNVVQKYQVVNFIIATDGRLTPPLL